MKMFCERGKLKELWWIVQYKPSMFGEITAEWVNARILRIRSIGTSQIHSLRLEAGHLKKRVFRKDKFVRKAYWPMDVVESYRVVSGEGKFE